MNTKKEYKYFTVADIDKEADYLTAVHAKGWELTDISRAALIFLKAYQFKACQPAALDYLLVYQNIQCRQGDFVLPVDAQLIICRDCYAYYRLQGEGCKQSQQLKLTTRRQICQRLFLSLTPLLVTAPYVFLPIREHQFAIAYWLLATFELYMVFLAFKTLVSYVHLKRNLSL